MCRGWWLVLALLTPAAGLQEEIRAAVILPADPRFVAALPKVLPVLDVAAERAAKPLLPGRRLVFFPLDDRCDAHHALKAAVNAEMCPDDKRRIHVFFGPNCEYCVSSVSRLLKYWSTPLLTTGALTFDFTKDKRAPDSEFHLLVRMGHLSFASMAHFIIAILNKYGWQKVALVYQRNGCKAISGKFTSKLMMETLVEFLKKKGINYRAYDLEKNNMSLAVNLQREIGNDYSIVVVCADPQVVREILLVAEELNMIDSGEYVFFNIELFNNQYNMHNPWYVEGDTEERNNRAKKAFTALLTVTARTPESASYMTFSDEIKRIAKDNFNYTFGPDPVSTFVTAFYDAVLLYALALNETLASGGNQSNGLIVTKNMWNRTFEGITGKVNVDKNGDRVTDYSLLDMDPETNEFRIVAHYIGLREKLEYVNGARIHWSGGRDSPPPDTPECGFDNSLCKSVPIYGILSIVLSSVVIVLAIASGFMYRSVRLQAQWTRLCDRYLYTRAGPCAPSSQAMLI